MGEKKIFLAIGWAPTSTSIRGLITHCWKDQTASARRIRKASEMNTLCLNADVESKEFNASVLLTKEK